MSYATVSVTMDETDQTIERTRTLRERAQALIASLRAAQTLTEERLKTDQREDAMASVRGVSSFDRAIEQAEHTRDVLDRALESADDARA